MVVEEQRRSSSDGGAAAGSRGTAELGWRGSSSDGGAAAGSRGAAELGWRGLTAELNMLEMNTLTEFGPHLRPNVYITIWVGFRMRPNAHPPQPNATQLPFASPPNLLAICSSLENAHLGLNARSKPPLNTLYMFMFSATNKYIFPFIISNGIKINEQ